uniref:Uncharacterized protein n=1 Tax=Xenopus tropicalis TaxID=8364 RepID=A0A6I8SUT8_XENTR
VTTVYSVSGSLKLKRILVCVCVFFRYLTRLKVYLLKRRKGYWGLFFRLKVWGSKLRLGLSVGCLQLKEYIIFIG